MGLESHSQRVEGEPTYFQANIPGEQERAVLRRDIFDHVFDGADVTTKYLDTHEKSMIMKRIPDDLWERLREYPTSPNKHELADELEDAVRSKLFN